MRTKLQQPPYVSTPVADLQADMHKPALHSPRRSRRMARQRDQGGTAPCRDACARCRSAAARPPSCRQHAWSSHPPRTTVLPARPADTRHVSAARRSPCPGQGRSCSGRGRFCALAAKGQAQQPGHLWPGGLAEQVLPRGALLTRRPQRSWLLREARPSAEPCRVRAARCQTLRVPEAWHQRPGRLHCQQWWQLQVELRLALQCSARRTLTQLRRGRAPFEVQ